MIIGLCNSKGGVGKSTLGRNILVYLTDQRIKSALIDAEEHAPTATLLNKFDSNLVCRSATTLDAIDDAVTELSNDGYHVILDAPGKEGDQVSTVCLLSDLVIIPLCLSDQDILQTAPVINLVRRQRERSRDQKPDAVIVFTQTEKNDAAAHGARKNFERFGISIASTEIRHLKPIARHTSVMRNTRFYSNNGPAVDFKVFIEEVITPRLSEPTQRSANE